MMIFTYLGIVIFTYVLIYGLSAFIGFMFQGTTESLRMDTFGAGLTLTVFVLTLILVGMGLSFYTAPEDYGYTKIETESEVVIDE